MVTIKILILGAGGMLGHVTMLYLQERGHRVIGISKRHYLNANTILLNILDISELEKLLSEHYDVVINCVALLRQESYKNHSDATLLNAWFPHKLEKMLSGTKTKIIQVSTDGIFSGISGPYFENSIPDAQDFYGKSKSLGEIENNKDLTVRASFMGPDYREEGQGLFHWIVRQKGTIRGYTDVKLNGVTSLEFAKFILTAISQDVTGIFHLGAAESISKYDFISLSKKVFQLNDLQILSESTVHTDHTLLCRRQDAPYLRINYIQMMEELKSWMREHKSIYPGYQFLWK